MKTTVTRVEYEGIYRILITSSADSLAEQRNLNDVLTAIESAGQPVDGSNAEGMPRMFSVAKETTIELTSVGVETLKSHIDKGIGRFQSWSVRELPAVIDRLESSGGKN
jgi:hypothetical protein